MKKYREFADVIDIDGAQMVSVLHDPGGDCTTGVLIIVGGPQTRIGSHRQFILLARFLAEHGYPVLRFDYRGMGDSDGENADFENAQADISAALDYFFKKKDSLDKVLVWGLCDAASAALMYAVNDPRISKMILLNPWVRTEEGRAKAYLKYYYLRRLLDKSFWLKLFSGKLSFRETYVSIKELLAKARSQTTVPNKVSGHVDDNRPLPERMAQGFKRFKGKVLIVLSGNNDYVADEFRELLKSSQDWKRLVTGNNVQISEFPEANHTFSRQIWRSRIENITLEFLGDNQVTTNKT